MRMDIVVRPEAEHQVAAARALSAGLKRHGHEPRIVGGVAKTTADVVACWGWRNGAQHAARGACVLVIECGYAGDRLHWLSLGWNGLNGRAQFPSVEDGGARWRKHFGDLMRPRRMPYKGSYTLVLGQVRGDAALEGLDLGRWYAQAARQLRFRYSGPLVFRPHPVDVRRYGMPARGALHGMELATGSLEEALSGARAAVAFNSNSLTDAALFGVPVVACDEGAMAWPVAGRGMEAHPVLGDREPWAHRLAWCQWSLSEIESGEAWDAVGGDVTRWN